MIKVPTVKKNKRKPSACIFNEQNNKEIILFLRENIEEEKTYQQMEAKPYVFL